jgi:hypothetical protein
MRISVDPVIRNVDSASNQRSNPKVVPTVRNGALFTRQFQMPCGRKSVALPTGLFSDGTWMERDEQVTPHRGLPDPRDSAPDPVQKHPVCSTEMSHERVTFKRVKQQQRFCESLSIQS